MQKVEMIQISKIIIGERRNTNPEKVRELAESIKSIGLINPITLDSQCKLLAGGHRLEAFKLLGYKEIDSIIIKANSLNSELIEIDENLIRNELHYTERGDLLKRRKEIYEEMHPETKNGQHGNKGGKIVEKTESALSSFVKDTSQKTGKSESVIKEEIRISKNIAPEIKQVLKDRDVSKSEALKIAQMGGEDQKKIIKKIERGEADTVKESIQIIKKEERELNIQKQKEEISSGKSNLPVGKYQIIMMDVPWGYGTKYDSNGRRAANPYPEMSIEEIKDLDIPASDNCILFFWTTQRFLKDGFDIINNYGFDYKGLVVWNKEDMGLGTYLRMQCEFCLIGFKGKPIWDAKNIRDIITEKGREHSRKPETLYRIIEENFVGRKLEYFSREKREGWDQFGNDKNKF